MMPSHRAIRPIARMSLRSVALQPSLLLLARALRPAIWKRARSVSTFIGADHSGQISTGENESILFVNNLFPLRLVSLLARLRSDHRVMGNFFQKEKGVSYSSGLLDPTATIKSAIPPSCPLQIRDIIPSFKDGGAFVKFARAPSVSPTDMERKVMQHLISHPLRPWFNPFRRVEAGLVRGKPWLEDLHRFPRSRLRVEFLGNELSQETLYSLFRRYGKIADMSPQPHDSKVQPRYAHVDFVLERDAIMARNCMHGYLVQQAQGDEDATKLSLVYEQKVKPHHVWDWMTSHPRLVVPALAALLAATTVAVFDPIREFFVKAHVQQSFKISKSRLCKWLMRQTSDILALRTHKDEEEAGLKALFSHRKELIDSIRSWLLETADTFIVVHGPRGSGKKEVVLNQVLQGRNDVLVLDCKPIIEGRGEAGRIGRLAGELGYWPVFSWANNVSSMIDLAVQSTTGVKAGFSETFESQVTKMLQAAAAGLKDVALSAQEKGGEDDLSEEAYLEAHPERRAVVVINNFLHKSEDGGIVYDKIAEWAAALVQSNISHVIFLTSDALHAKFLSKALPDRTFHQATLDDLSPDMAKKFVLSQVNHRDRKDEQPRSHDQVDSHQLDQCIDVLGGRLTDLQVLARRLKAGQKPLDAVSEIIDQAAAEILRMFLVGSSRQCDHRRHSVQQAWHLIRELGQVANIDDAGSSCPTLRYNQVLLSPTFSKSTTASDGAAALEALSNAELISVTSSHNGRPQAIHPGKPVYRAAFRKLCGDAGLQAKMELAVLTELVAVAGKTIESCENELSVLGSLPTQPKQTEDRVVYLLEKLRGSQVKIQAWEAEMGRLEGVLSREA